MLERGMSDHSKFSTEIPDDEEISIADQPVEKSKWSERDAITSGAKESDGDTIGSRTIELDEGDITEVSEAELADTVSDVDSNNTLEEFGGAAGDSSGSKVRVEKKLTTETQKGFAGLSVRDSWDRNMATVTEAERDRDRTTDPIEFFNSLTRETRGSEHKSADDFVTIVADLRAGDTKGAEEYLGRAMEKTFAEMQEQKRILQEREQDLGRKDRIKSERWKDVKIQLDDHEDRLFQGGQNPMSRHFIREMKKRVERDGLGDLLEPRNKIAAAERTLARYNAISDKLNGVEDKLAQTG
ncbi:MAG: hypothetical protein ABII72_02445 [Parcubacteria group bacterium]